MIKMFIFSVKPASLVAQTVKNLPVRQETQVWFLGQKNPLEKRMVTHSSILSWRIPWTEEPGGFQCMGLQRVRHNWATNTHTQATCKPWSHLFNKSLCLHIHWASLVAQRVKNLPAMQETWVQSLGQKNPLEKRMAIHSSILAWKIPRTEEPGRLLSVESQIVRHSRVTFTHYTSKEKQIVVL